MNDKAVFIGDEQVLNDLSLLSEQGSAEYQKGENAELFLNYLSYRLHNKKMFMIPSLYKKICEKLKTDSGESLSYFKNWIEIYDVFIKNVTKIIKVVYFELEDHISPSSAKL